MKKNIFFSLFFSFSFLACEQQPTMIKNTKETVSSENTVKNPLPITDASKTELAEYFYDKELAAILEIKAVFNKGLVNGKEDVDYAQAYKNHSHRMRADYFNKFPYTLNFPYNDKFDLSQVSGAVSHLSFLSNKCGFQDAKNNTTIHHYCFELESNYFSFLEALGRKNELIQQIVEDYKKNKTITSEAKYAMMINSYDTLNFEKIEHQIIYLFFQIIVNEERLAVNKLQKSAS